MSKQDKDRQIGANLVRIRDGMSQNDLALKMRERGHKWSAATVWAIEKGERPLKLAEATDVISILGIDLHYGLDELLETDDIMLRPIRKLVDSMRNTHNEIRGKLPAYYHDAVRLAMYAGGELDQLKEEGNRFLLNEICRQLENVGIASVPANADELMQALEGMRPDEWVEDNRPFSTFLFGTHKEIGETRKALGLDEDID